MDEPGSDVEMAARHPGGPELNGSAGRPAGQPKAALDLWRRPFLLLARTIEWVPVVFIAAVTSWSYYAFVVVVCLSMVDNWPERLALMLCYHAVLGMFVWSYAKTIVAPVSAVPDKWRLSQAESMLLEQKKAESESSWKQQLDMFVLAKGLNVSQRSIQQAVRYCERCELIKPDRSHHCSICGQCILKMDHHCPWVRNCVAFSNYKFFMLFLFYALAYCGFLVIAVARHFVGFWAGGSSDGPERFHMVFLFLVALMFCISVSSLFWYHVYLISNNRSTLEQFRAPVFASGPDEDGWSMGKSANFREVFGDKWYLWLVPVFTSMGNGLDYPTRCSVAGIEAAYRSTSRRSPTLMHSSPAAKAVVGHANDISFIDEASDPVNGRAPRQNTAVIMDGDQKISVKVARGRDNDLVQLH